LTAYRSEEWTRRARHCHRLKDPMVLTQNRCRRDLKPEAIEQTRQLDQFAIFIPLVPTNRYTDHGRRDRASDPK
jgi:hypothetical protein